jgi:phage RecT family recombinase
MSQAVATTVSDRAKPRSLQEREGSFATYLDNNKGNITGSLPAHLTYEKFKSVILAATRRNPGLLMADGRSLFEASMQCASDGLMPDGREALLGVYNTKVKDNGKDIWIKTVQYMPMVQGLIKLMRNSGDVSSIVCQVVYKNDGFEHDPASGKRPVHKVNYDEDAGDLRLVYAIIEFKDGSIQVEVMRRSEVDSVRARSKSAERGPWVTDYNEMARKTVLRRASKYVPKSPELIRAIEADNNTYDLGLAPPTPRAALPKSINDDFQPEQIAHDDAGTVEEARDLDPVVPDADAQDPNQSEPDQPYGVADFANDIANAQSRLEILALFQDAYESPAFEGMTPASILDITKHIVLTRFDELGIDLPDVDDGPCSYLVHLAASTNVEQLRVVKANFEKTKAFIDMCAARRSTADAYYAVARKALAAATSTEQADA